MNTRVRGQSSSGFTIVETLIFLGVTAVMLVSALLLVGGQQRKTEFTQAVRDIESQIKDVANDVSTGYYSSSSNFTCKDNGASKLVISSDISKLGTNSDCIFIGRAVQFKVEGSDGEGFALYNIAGKRGASELSSAKVTALAPVAGTERPSSVDSRKLLYGLKAKK
jgi:type II secretory pathway pseudopilin PulG